MSDKRISRAARDGQALREARAAIARAKRAIQNRALVEEAAHGSVMSLTQDARELAQALYDLVEELAVSAGVVEEDRSCALDSDICPQCAGSGEYESGCCPPCGGTGRAVL